MPPPTPLNRLNRLKRQQWLLGVACTCCIMVLWFFGAFHRIELPTIDWRTRWFNRWAGGPSPAVVIMGIDELATDEQNLGRWPWDRQILAAAINELQVAGARTIALDVLLDEPQNAESDAALAAAIRSHGCVILPIRSRNAAETTSTASVSPLALAENAHVRDVIAAHQDDDIAAHLVAPRLVDVMPDVGPDELRTLLPAVRAIIASASRSTIPVDAYTTAAPIRPHSAQAPIPAFTAAAASMGDVSITLFDPDGVFRRMPLWTRLNNDHLWPAFSLAAVASHLRSPPSELRASPASTIDIPSMPPRAIHAVPAEGHPYVHPLAWPRGGRSWNGQFAVNNGLAPREISFVAACEPLIIQRATRQNLRTLAELLQLATDLNLGEYSHAVELANQLAEVRVDSQQWHAGLDNVAAASSPAAVEAVDFLEFAGPVDDAAFAALSDVDARTLLQHRAVAAKIPAIIEECRSARSRMDAARMRLRNIVGEDGGRLVFIGWIASGAVADAVNTSLGPRTPGVYVHAAAASSFLTSFVRLPVHPIGDAFFIFVMGLGGTFAARRAAVWFTPIVVALLIGLWALVASAFIWDLGWRIAAIAAPSAAAFVSWLAVLLHRLLVEQRLRRRTEERFRAYVSPAVVDELVNNPQLDSMTPQRRELAIMFCDVTGFTSIAERLGAEGTARFLTGYLGRMTDTLLRHNATIDKYLGDGIMAFWGAPITDPRHARNACRAAIALARAVADLERPDAMPGDPGHITIRIGLAAGDVMVGDFGNPPIRSSYTVLGDACNIAARLERASKILCTTILVSASVRAQAGDGFLWRPLGTFILHGRLAPEPIFELIGMTTPGSKAIADETLAVTPGHGRRLPSRDNLAAWILLTEQAVSAFAEARYDEARAAFTKLASDFGDDALARMYLAAINRRTSGEPLDEPVNAIRLSVS